MLEEELDVIDSVWFSSEELLWSRECELPQSLRLSLLVEALLEELLLLLLWATLSTSSQPLSPVAASDSPLPV